MVNFALAQDIAQVNSDSKVIDITDFIEASVVDESEFGKKEWSLPDQLDMDFDGKISKGYSNEILFLRLRLKNSEDKYLEKILYFDHILTGEVELFDGEETQTSGSSIPTSKRAIQSIFTAFKISIEPNQLKDYYLRIKSVHLLNSKILLTNAQNFKLIEVNKFNIFRFYTGAILALLFYNLFIAIFLRDYHYYYYSAFIFSLYITVIALNGIYDDVNIFRDKTLSHYLILFSSSSLILATAFTKNIINPNKIVPVFDTIFKRLMQFGLVPILFCFTPLYENNIKFFGLFIDLLLVSGLALMTIYGIIGTLKKDILAKVYTFSWGCIFSGVILYFFGMYGVIRQNWLTTNSVLIGNVLQMLTLSLGLGFRVIILRKEKDEALHQASTKERYQKLLRVLSHDVSNSLQVVQLSLKRLKKNLKFKDNQTQVDRIIMVANNMRDILDNVKKEQRLEQDKESIELSKVSLSSAIKSALLIIEDKIKEKNISIKMELSDEADLVMAEEVSLINNVLGNIFSNAIKFTPNGGIIEVQSRKIEDQIELTIRDEGNGFSDEIIRRFEANESIQSTSGTEGEEGTGFGLQIIKSYIEIYNGTVKLKNRGGAEFYLLFKAV